MVKQKKFGSNLIISFLLFCSGPLCAEKISKIQVLGNNRIEKAAILEKMKMAPGSSVSSGAVRRDILNIFSLGFFQDVRMDLVGSTLKVSVQERPVVVEIEYNGAHEFDDEELSEITKIKQYRVLNIAEIRTAQKSISKSYEDKGYYLASADFKIEPLKNRPNEVKLVFSVNENEKVKVRKIFFTGNSVFDSAELKQIMMSSEGHAFSWMTNGGTFREDFFERDLSALAFFYGNEGYIEAKFSKPRVTLSQDRRYIDAIIDVDEGKEFFLEAVSFRGDVDFSEEELMDSLGMEEGDVFSTGKLQQGILSLTDKYGDLGYAFANVVPRPDINSDTQKVDLIISIQKGEKVYWGKVNVSGNTATHDKVVRRELRFAEGELYNATKKKKSFDRIRRLGFFGEDIQFLTKTRKLESNVLDLNIRVEEKPTGTLNVSAGYGSASKFVFGGNLAQNNLFGRGQQIQLSLNLASNQASTFNLSFTDPKINDSEWLFGTDFFLSQRRIGPQSDDYTYLKRTTGGYLRLGREISENWNLIGRYRLTYTEHKDPINPLIFTNGKDDQYSTISSLSSDLVYDTRNNRLDPTDGAYFSASAEFGGLGGRVFQSYDLTARYYKKLFWKLVYRTNVNYGALMNVFDEDNVPDSERYVIGGISSVRGYDPASVGSLRRMGGTRNGSSPLVKDYVIGGTQKFVMNHELEMPLIPEANIRAVFFFDIGNAWDDPSELSPFLLTNYGWGIRWYSPMGPLRFEWGYPLTGTTFNQPNDPVFHFMIAPTF